METRGSSVVDVQRYLIKDERVVWSAQPVRKFFLKYLFSQDPSRFLGYYFIVFGLVFALMPLLVFVSMPPGPPSKGEPPIILFAVFGLFFAGMGYVLSFGRRRRVIKQLGNTAYYLTNARAFIVSGADGPTVDHHRPAPHASDEPLAGGRERREHRLRRCRSRHPEGILEV